MSRVLTLANTRLPAVDKVPPWLKPADSPRQRSFPAIGSQATRMFPCPSGPIEGGDGGGGPDGPLPRPPAPAGGAPAPRPVPPAATTTAASNPGAKPPGATPAAPPRPPPA